MASKEVKTRMRERLSSVSDDIRQSKVKTRLTNVEKVDGKLSANFSISGLPSKKDNYSETYRDIPKIFDDWTALYSYAGTFFNLPIQKNNLAGTIPLNGIPAIRNLK